MVMATGWSLAKDPFTDPRMLTPLAPYMYPDPCFSRVSEVGPREGMAANAPTMIYPEPNFGKWYQYLPPGYNPIHASERKTIHM